jgi:hypothetical protein
LVLLVLVVLGVEQVEVSDRDILYGAALAAAAGNGNGNTAGNGHAA